MHQRLACTPVDLSNDIDSLICLYTKAVQQLFNLSLFIAIKLVTYMFFEILIQSGYTGQRSRATSWMQMCQC